MGERKVSGISTAAILIVASMGMGFTVVTPAMGKLFEHFADPVLVPYVSTLPTITTVIGSFLIGALVGKKISYKMSALLGNVLALIGGLAPAFFDDIMGLLVCRAIIGLGLGFIAPLANALIIGNFEGTKQQKMLGFSTLFMNLGGIIFQLLGGALADMNWQYTFYAHIIFVIAIIFSLMLPEPPKVEVAAGPKEKMNPKVWLAGILLMAFNIFSFPVMMFLANLFEYRNAGGAAVASITLSCYTVAGMVAGFLFGFIFKFLKRFIIVLGYLLCGLGAMLVFMGGNAALMTAGIIMLGFGFNCIMPAIFALVGMITPGSTVGFGMSIIMGLTNLGGFISTYWIQGVTELTMANSLFQFGVAGFEMESAFILNMIFVESIVFLCFAVFFLIFNPFRKTPLYQAPPK